MKRDIRKLFSEEENMTKKLPNSHRTEFLNKLEKTKNNKPKSLLRLKVVAALLLLFSVSYLVINSSEKQPPIVAKVAQMEKEYIANINTEWKNFLKLTDNKKLINYYEKKLSDLSLEYKAISIQFKKDPNNILVLEQLISNLQTRLEILKEIQHHIKQLTSKNTNYETILL